MKPACDGGSDGEHPSKEEAGNGKGLSAACLRVKLKILFRSFAEFFLKPIEKKTLAVLQLYPYVCELCEIRLS